MPGSQNEGPFGEIISQMAQSASFKRGIVKLLEQMWTAEPAIVVGYNFERGTVDVEMMNYPEDEEGEKTMATVQDVPVLGFGGDHPTRQKVQTTADGDPTVGMMIFSRSSSLGSFQDREKTEPDLQRFHAGDGGGFLPFFTTQADPDPSVIDANATVDDLDKFGPNDLFLRVFDAGEAGEGFILVKEDRTCVIQLDEVRIGTPGSDPSTYETVDTVGTGSAVNLFAEE